jgi:hypothetical protein
MSPYKSKVLGGKYLYMVILPVIGIYQYSDNIVVSGIAVVALHMVVMWVMKTFHSHYD